MARVVGVHGIAQEYRGPNILASTWLPSLRDGLGFAGARLEPDDFAIAFYGDMFRAAGTMAGGLPPLDANDLDTAEDAELLHLLWEEAARVDGAVPGPGADTMARTPRMVQRALNALSQSAFFAGVAERFMVGTVKQVQRYFTDAVVRANAIASVEQVVTEQTRVVIGHSLGSVVAYEALAAHPEWGVHSLVTVGSPLGISNVIFDRLNPPPVNGRGTRPGSLTAWVNVAAPGDVVALVKRLADKFDDVTDHSIDTGVNAHDISPYLSSVEVGQAVAAGLA